MGVPAHNERTTPSPTNTTCPSSRLSNRSTAAERTCHTHPTPATGCSWTWRVRRPRQFRRPRAPARARGRRVRGDLPPAGLAHLAAALLGDADPHRPLRRLRTRSGPRGGPPGGTPDDVQTTGPARRRRGVETDELSRLRGRRGAGDGPMDTSATPRGTSSGISRRTSRTRPSTREPPTSGSRSTCTSAARNTQCCTSSIYAFSPARCRTSACWTGKNRSSDSSIRGRCFTAARRCPIVGQRHRAHEYGAETTRLFVLSAAHPSQDFEWTVKDVSTAYDFQQTLYRLVTEYTDRTETRTESTDHDTYVEREIDRTIAAVTEEYDRFRFHRVIGEIQRFARLLGRYAGSTVPTSSPTAAACVCSLA